MKLSERIENTDEFDILAGTEVFTDTARIAAEVRKLEAALENSKAHLEACAALLERYSAVGKSYVAAVSKP